MAVIYKSGNVEETYTYTVGANTKVRRTRIKGNTSPKKQEQNDNRAARELARQINCNFSHGDVWVRLGYSSANRPTDRQEAQKKMQAFLKRVKRALEKRGIPLKYIMTPPVEIDGETGEAVNLHHHLIMPRLAFDVVSALWGWGSVDYQILRDQKDYTPLAVYIIRQTKGVPNGKKWSSSRNLAKPIVEEIVLEAGEEIKLPKGAVILHRDEYDRERGREYTRYILPEADARRVRSVGAKVYRPKRRRN